MILFLDGLAAFFMLWMGILGFKRGLIEELGRLLGLIVATMVAMRYYVNLAGIAIRWLDIQAWILLLLSYAIIFSLTLLVMRFLTRMIHYLLVSKGIRWVNKSMGFIFGAMKGAVIVMLVIWLIDISPLNKWANILHKESVIAEVLSNTRVEITKSFGWDDPVKKGENFIKKITSKINKKVDI